MPPQVVTRSATWAGLFAPDEPSSQTSHASTEEFNIPICLTNSWTPKMETKLQIWPKPLQCWPRASQPSRSPPLGWKSKNQNLIRSWYSQAPTFLNSVFPEFLWQARDFWQWCHQDNVYTILSQGDSSWLVWTWPTLHYWNNQPGFATGQNLSPNSESTLDLTTPKLKLRSNLDTSKCATANESLNTSSISNDMLLGSNGAMPHYTNSSTIDSQFGSRMMFPEWANPTPSPHFTWWCK